MAIKISESIAVAEEELEYSYLRARGAGGQHVNKSSTGVLLRYRFLASPGLPEWFRQRLLAWPDHRIGGEGEILVRADSSRSQEFNRQDARRRLIELLRKVAVLPKKRRPTRPTAGSRVKRLNNKISQGTTKKLRRAVGGDDYL